MKKLILILVAGLLLVLCLPQDGFCDRGRGHSHGGHFHHSGPRVSFGWSFGFPYYYPDYPYYYPHPGYYPYRYPYNYYPYPYYPYPYYPSAPPVRVEPRQERYWYYCRNPEGYYPYVQSCPGGWTRVLPGPQDSGQGGEGNQ